MRQLLWTVPIAIALLAGCSTRSTLSSVPLSRASGLDLDDPTGPVYFLPITVLEIEGAPCLKAEVKDGSAAPSPAKDAAATGTVVNVVNNNGEKPDASAPTPAQTEKPKPCKADDPAADYGIKITSRTVPDTLNGYQVSFPMANFSSNKPVVKIDSSGLLTSANSVSKDETREAVVSFGKSVGMLAEVGLLGQHPSKNFELLWNVPGLAIDPGAAATPKPKVHKFCIVKSLSGEVACTKASVADNDAARLSVSLIAATSGGDPIDTVDCKQRTKDGSTPNGDPCAAAALMFRTRVGVLAAIDISESDGAPTPNFQSFAQTTTVLPVVDPAKDYAVTAIARPFVQSETKLTFDKGVLTGFEGDYPSTGGASVSLPSDFIGSIFSGFSNAISLRGDAKSSEIDLLKAQTELLNAQIELEAARRDAEE